MKIKAFIYWRVIPWHEQGGKYTITDSDNYEKVFPGEYFLRGEHEVDFIDANDIDPRALIINHLKTEKANLIKEATAKAEQIEEKIQQLLALPQSVEASE